MKSYMEIAYKIAYKIAYGIANGANAYQDRENPYSQRLFGQICFKARTISAWGTIGEKPKPVGVVL